MEAGHRKTQMLAEAAAERQPLQRGAHPFRACRGTYSERPTCKASAAHQVPPRATSTSNNVHIISSSQLRII